MSAYKSEFLRVLAQRGFIHQVSDAEGLDAKAAAGPVTAYVGFDATAPSLHIGNLLTIMMLRWLQKTGHRPIALMGGSCKIGDPSGRAASRTLLTAAQIDANIASIRTVFLALSHFSAGAIMANNADWLTSCTTSVLRDASGIYHQQDAHLRLGQASPRPRAAMTFLEFNYMILQAYDFVELTGATAASCGWADQPVGQHRQRYRSRAASGRGRAVRSDHAMVTTSRAPRWARPRPARSGSTPT
jgi:tyrosyl-tRNA synthetase